ncbi:Kynurenine formamidase [Candida viswanathii]|uniref:Kynurenine formamidase n=1 Tax=Candida viswanathii TaxID=5486 RepID=A0A367YDH1_9ASCO|nr:Kynurenine formamidase [Candida viswanathii]
MAATELDNLENTIVAYGSHELQNVKVFNYAPTNDHTFVYIHGGAWRDPSNTFDEMAPVVASNPDANHIGINYRLSPGIKHPEHLIDVLRALKLINSRFKVGKITLLGHSVGATMILQLLHFKQIVKDGLKHLDSEEDLDDLLDYVKKNIRFEQLLFLDGIYDVVELLKEYPDYSSFVDDAFVNAVHARDATQLSSKNAQLDEPFSLVNKDTKFVIYQSLEDELLSMKQTHLLIDYLVSKNQKFSLHAGNWGKHEEIYAGDRSIVFHGKFPN